MRGKLLIKIDAKFVPPPVSDSANRMGSPARSDNRLSSQDNSPMKLMQSPRRHPGVNCHYDYNSSPAIQSIASRKSDTSVFSIHSVSSTRSQEQGVQTDLSLPIIPDISKFTQGLRHSLGTGLSSAPLSRNYGKPGSAQLMQSGSSRNNSDSEASVATAVPVGGPLLDPLKIAEDILLQRLQTSKNPTRRCSEPVSQASKPPLQGPNSAYRRSCLVKQHENDKDRRRPSKDFDLESLEDVIEILNCGGNDLDDAFFTDPQADQGPSSKQTAKPPVPPTSTGVSKLSSAGTGSRPNRALQRESISSSGSASVQIQSRQQSASPVEGGTTDTVRHDRFDQRFREIHFDGVQAKQQATAILMTRTTAQSSSATGAHQHPPVVTRRRIAAAIFND